MKRRPLDSQKSFRDREIAGEALPFQTSPPVLCSSRWRGGVAGLLEHRGDDLDSWQSYNLSHDIPVMHVKHFPEMFNTYCPTGLLDDCDDCLSSKLQLTDNESDSDEGFFSEEEAESPNMNAVKELSVHVTETVAVKRSLLDQFSSTQISKKKKVVVVNEEKGADDKET
nr:putative transposase [Ipomoea batatas]